MIVSFKLLVLSSWCQKAYQTYCRHKILNMSVAIKQVVERQWGAPYNLLYAPHQSNVIRWYHHHEATFKQIFKLPICSFSARFQNWLEADEQRDARKTASPTSPSTINLQSGQFLTVWTDLSYPNCFKIINSATRFCVDERGTQLTSINCN